MGGEDDVTEELSLELSIGGKYGKTENLRETGIPNDFPVSRCDFSGVAVENGCETVDPQRRREIQALRRQEARRKREEKINKSRRQNAVGFVDDKMFLEAQKFRTRVRDREIREKGCFFEGKNVCDDVSDELGLSLFSEKSGREKECLFPKVASPVDCDSEYSNGVKSSEQCSSAVSDHHSLSHKGGSSSDTGSQIESHDSWSQAETADLGEAKLVPQPSSRNRMRAGEVSISNGPERRIVPSRETSNAINAAGSLPRMPCVSATGNGPNGRTVTGFLYTYNKTGVSIMCVCHGSSFSPAEFVAHAGGVDVTHPLKHITIVPSPHLH